MFNERNEEYSNKSKKMIPVWQTPKYKQSREKALEIMKKYKNIQEGDFWVLMNETKSGKMAYTGLIISHNGCLKLNDQMPEDKRFDPECVTVDKAGYGNSLVFTYVNAEQGLYEVGEVKPDNCKNAYPYAMAFKRCFDRVVLKLSKLAYDGIYSDSEADEFAERFHEPTAKTEPSQWDVVKLKALIEKKGLTIQQIEKRFGVSSIWDLSDDDLKTCVDGLQKMEDK